MDAGDGDGGKAGQLMLSVESLHWETLKSNVHHRARKLVPVDSIVR